MPPDRVQRRALGRRPAGAVGGAHEVLGIEQKEIFGNIQRFYVLRVLESDNRILVPIDKSDQVGLRRVAGKRRRLAGMVGHVTQGRPALAITYKAIEDEFKGIPGVEVAHFGELEGRDQWGDVEALIVIGRPLASPQDIRDMAAAVTGRPVIAGGKDDPGAAVWQPRAIEL